MSAILFEVIDVACEQADQSFFTPQIVLTTKSTTQFATVYGYSEFVPSSPPKKYRKVTVSGLSERVGFTMEETPRQCAGAMYVWSGAGEYNLKGVLTQSYSKKFYAQCGKQYWPFVPLQTTPFAVSPSTSLFANQFVGYCWPADLQSCPVCDPNIVNWPFLGEQVTNNLQVDLAGFRLPPNSIVTTHTSYSVTGAQFFGFFALTSPPHNFFVGNAYTVTVGPDSYPARTVTTDIPLVFPTEIVNGVEGAYVNFADATNLSAVLSEEYTDADALSNATIVIGTSKTAQTTPRTTGFTSIFTSVVFTLHCVNLQSGKDYLVTVDLWESSSLPTINKHTIKQYGFTATDTTHDIIDTVPTPDPFHTITVSKPTIAFSNP